MNDEHLPSLYLRNDSRLRGIRSSAKKRRTLTLRREARVTSLSKQLMYK